MAEHCRGHKGGAALICNITGKCPFAGASSDYDKVTIQRPIVARKLKSPVVVEKAKPRGIHVARQKNKDGENKN